MTFESSRPVPSICKGLTLLLGMFALSPVAFAAEGRQLEEVVVTAERQEASVQDTSISITALTGDMLEDFGVKDQADFQNLVPALVVLPYDSSIRGVGRNFRALGGDPGVSTYVNSVYSEDLYTATIGSFWDLSRVEVLRGPQGTLYGRNAIGGAMNFLYNRPSEDFDYKFRGVIGNHGANELYGYVNGGLMEDYLSGRFSFSNRERDGYVDDIGGGPDLDSRDEETYSIQVNWTPLHNLEMNTRVSLTDVNRVVGGADSAGLIVFRGESIDGKTRDFSTPYFHYRAVDPAQTNRLASSYVSPRQDVVTFNNPTTGAAVMAQRVRPGIDEIADFPRPFGGYGYGGDPTACVFLDKDSIKGNDLCTDTNGLNFEKFNEVAWQVDLSWEATDNLLLKYIFGFKKYDYGRLTDQDQTSNKRADSHFYVNHEMKTSSHEFQGFYDMTDNLTFTSGAFFYEATIDQRGDLHSVVGEPQFSVGVDDGNDPLAAALPLALWPALQAVGQAVTPGQASLMDAKTLWYQTNREPTGGTTFSILGVEGGDPGGLGVKHGIDSPASHTEYGTRTKRKAYALYTQGVWDINDVFTLTFGARWAKDDLFGEESLLIANQTSNTAIGGGLIGAFGTAFQLPNLISNTSPFYDPNATTVNSLAAYNVLRGALDPVNLLPTGANYVVPGLVMSSNAYRSDERSDDEITWRLNLDWNIDDNQMMYFSATTGYRGGGYNLVFFSQTMTYDPEKLRAYEIGYKSQMLDNTLQLNTSVYFYDYSTIHTFGTEVGALGGTSTSVLEAPGAEIRGFEVEAVWLATDRISLGGNYSYTPSEYTESLFIRDGADIRYPESVIPSTDSNLDIKGNQLLHVAENKGSAWASYNLPLGDNGSLDLLLSASWIDEVYFSQFETDFDRAPGYERYDLRATWTSPSESLVVTGFVHNILDEIGIRQIERGDESEGFVRKGHVTEPRMMGLELTYSLQQ